MPEDGEGEDIFTPTAGGDMLTAEELQRLLRLFVRLGVRKVRLTGGEPTVRGDFDRILQDMGEVNAGLPEPMSMGITTNGVRLRRFLPAMRAGGLRNINLSLDTLQPAKFPFLAGKPKEWHARIMEVMHEIASQEEHFNLKLNCVLFQGANEDEIGSFVNLTESLPIEVRFLEFMPFDGNAWSANRLVPQADIVEAVQKHLEARGLRADRLPPDTPHDVARLWQVPGWSGRIGVIASMTDAFCGGCNRLRVTAKGEIRNCLFGEEGWSLRDLLRSGASDESLAATVAQATQRKHGKLGGKRDMFELRDRREKALPMIALGG